MKVNTFIIILVCASQLLLDSAQDSALRVVGGRDARPGEYPFVVRLIGISNYSSPTKNSTEIMGGCSAAALSPTWTLTAAHCGGEKVHTYTKTKSMTIERTLFIKYGNPHLKPSENHNLSPVLKRLFLNHKIRLHNTDIALYHTEPINITEYGRISAIDYTALYGSPVTLMGFGMMRASQKLNDWDFTIHLDKPLQVMNAVLKTCNEDEDKQNMTMCAVPQCGRDQWGYYGDSGGPVVHASGIVGINSAVPYDHWDKQTTKPDILVITPVSPYLNWIHSQVSTDNIEK